jgi:hypothetical protein
MLPTAMETPDSNANSMSHLKVNENYRKMETV